MKKYFFCLGLFFLSYAFCQEENEFRIPEFQIDFIEKEPNIDGEVKRWGRNSRLDNLQAAILSHKLKTYDKEYINLKDDKIETELNVDKVPLIIINNDQANIFKGKQAYDKLEEMILEEETPKKAANKTMKYGTKVNFIVPTDDKKERINLEKK